MLSIYGLVLLAGIASAIAPGQNASLTKSLGRTLPAALVCTGVSVLAFLIAVTLAGRPGWPDLRGAADAPWWAWGAGILSAILLLAQLTMPHRIGAATFLGLLVTAGVVTSILLDQFGLVGFDQHSASPARIAGGALMIAGVALVARS